MGLIFCYFCKNNICDNEIRVMDGYRLGKARDHPINTCFEASIFIFKNLKTELLLVFRAPEEEPELVFVLL